MAKGAPWCARRRDAGDSRSFVCSRRSPNANSKCCPDPTPRSRSPCGSDAASATTTPDISRTCVSHGTAARRRSASMPMIPGATDRLFLRFCRGGDTTALGKVFDRTAPELLRVALYLRGNRADAEDLLQRTFLQAIESRASYDQRRRAVPWLLGILANFAKRLLRERAQRLAAVPRLRAELGEPYANVLQLHLEQGLQAKEIAERLGRPAGTVRTQLVRALELLRKRLPSGFVAGLLPGLTDAGALASVKS